MKKRSKILLSAILTIALCLSLIAGSTFALFTSESKVNIAVTSGKVKVTATLVETSLKLYSATTDSKDAEEHPYEVAGTVTGTNYDATYYYEPVSPDFTNGGTAALSGDTLTLTNVTPGDKVKLNINVENESNVNIKYRTRIDVTGETDTKLFEALEISIDGDTQNKKTTISEWKTWRPDEPRKKVVPVTIALPINAGNEYQEKSIKLTFAVEAVQGNAAWALLDQINTKLANEAVANTNMSDALADIANIADESVIKANNFVWNSETDRFTTESAATTNQVKYFKIYDEMPDTQTYSIYASSSWAVDTVNVTVGFDAGTKTNITAITYDRQTATVAQTVIIRTNGGTLTVNAPLDTVKHYGDADNVNIVSVASASYHENGTVPFIQISKGRIEIEATGDVNGIHVANVQTIGENGEITKTENTFSHDVVLSLNGADVKLTRDTIGTEIATPVLVCEVQANANSDECIWLVGDGTIENAKVYVTETNAAPDTSVASTTTTENASAAAIAIANNAVNTGSEENPAYTAVDTGVKLNTSEDQEIWATYDSQAKLEYLINNTVFVNLKQIANIVDMTSVDIPKNRIICIDMNGYSIDTALQSEGRHHYAFYNYGELTLQDLSEEKTSYIKARGVENLGGKMTINSGTYYNIDTNGGAAVWNENQKTQINGGYIKKSEFDNAKNIFDEEDIAYFNQNFIIEDFDSNYLYQSSGRGFNLTNEGYGWILIYNKYEKEETVGDLTINGGNFIVEHVGSASDISGPGCVNSKVGTKLTINGGTFTSSNMRTYTIIADGETVINDCNVTGAHGALAIDAGSAIVNGGTFVCTQYYGCWITNNGTDTKVTINGGSFSGLYGLYSSVDDGGQDESNIAITINGGTFEGTSGSAVINDKATQNQFALMIYGGRFSSNPSTYVSTSYTITEDNGWFVVTK